MANIFRTPAGATTTLNWDDIPGNFDDIAGNFDDAGGVSTAATPSLYRNEPSGASSLFRNEPTQ